MTEEKIGYGNEETMKRTQIYLPTDMVEWLKEEAREQNSSMARVVREAVGEYRTLREEREAFPILEDDDPIWNIVGMLSGDDLPTDGAENHDKYIYSRRWDRE